MNKDMTIMFKAVDKYYKMPMQYKYTWNTLQNFGQFRDKRIWKNFEYCIIVNTLISTWPSYVTRVYHALGMQSESPSYYTECVVY